MDKPDSARCQYDVLGEQELLLILEFNVDSEGYQNQDGWHCFELKLGQAETLVEEIARSLWLERVDNQQVHFALKQERERIKVGFRCDTRQIYNFRNWNAKQPLNRHVIQLSYQEAVQFKEKLDQVLAKGSEGKVIA